MTGTVGRTKTLASLVLVILAAAVFLPGCGTILFGRTEAVYVDSDPQGAEIYLNGSVRGTTPCKIRIHRQRDMDPERWAKLQDVRYQEGRKSYKEEKRRVGRRPYTLVLKKEGHIPRVEHLRSATRGHRFAFMSLMYMLYLPMLGMQADFEAGVMDTVLPKVIYAELSPEMPASDTTDAPSSPSPPMGSELNERSAPRVAVPQTYSTSGQGIGTYVLHLEDGSKTQGTLMDHKPGKGYVLRRLDGTTVVFPEEDVVRLERVGP